MASYYETSGDIRCDITNASGKEVQDLLCKLVDKKWNKKKPIYFKVNGEYKIKVVPNPTHNQPGNGVVSFHKGKEKRCAPTWNELHGSALKQEKFPDYYKAFQEVKMSATKQMDFTERPMFQTCFLFAFEVARRIERSPECPSRQDTNDAIALSVKVKDYGNLMNMFTADASGGNFSQRRAALTKIKGQALVNTFNNMIKVMETLAISVW